MSDFLLARVAPMRRKRVVEGLAINILCVRWQMAAYRRRKVFI